MATILDKLSPQAEMGERMGLGISSGLKSLVDAKLKRMQKQYGLSALVGPEKAEALSYLPQGMTEKLLPQLLKNQQYQRGLAKFGGQNNTPIDPNTPIDTNTTDQTPEERRISKAGLDAFEKTGSEKEGMKAIEREKDRIIKEGHRQEATEKNTIAYLEPFRKELDQTRAFNARSINTIKMAQSGEMRAGNSQIFMEKMGLGEAFRNPITEFAQKELQGFSLGVASAFGKGMGKIMQAEFDAFVKSNANKFNSVEAISYIGQNNLLKNKVISHRQKIRNQIIKDNGNKVPVFLDEQIDIKSKPFEENIHDKMSKLNKLFATNKLPNWNKAKLNPAEMSSDSEVEIDGVPFRIEKGMWVPIYETLGAKNG